MLDQVQRIQQQALDTRRRPQPEEGPLTILYEDAAVLVVSKPAGIVVHPTYRNSSGTLLNAVLWHYRDRPGMQPGILTRLDKDTSGVVVMALTPQLHATMQKDMNAGRVTKEYLAVVNGVPDPPNGRISLPLGRSAEDRRIVVVRDDGQHCVTDYEILEVHDDWTLVRCKLHTGRTHQIRVHLATSGWPILGDRVYGTASERIARQALHAWRVTLSHPVTRELVSLTAPLPADVAALVAGPP
ncbi:MAG TPA: RluA family pseudouridine synthase [Vicinamibacterales bacterium]|nr:RluA family pseudouridine synthase [Vicinamibacterales bacterium]